MDGFFLVIAFFPCSRSSGTLLSVSKTCVAIHFLRVFRCNHSFSKVFFYVILAVKKSQCVEPQSAGAKIKTEETCTEKNALETCCINSEGALVQITTLLIIPMELNFVIFCQWISVVHLIVKKYNFLQQPLRTILLSNCNS